MVQLDDLRTLGEVYEREAGDADLFVDESMPEMIDVLDQTIERLHEQIKGIETTFGEPQFDSTQHYESPDVVVDELAALKAKMENYEQLGKQYNGIQKLFGKEETHFADLDAAVQHYEQLNKLWGTLASWTSKMETWTHEEFTSLHWEEESKEVQLFFKDSFSLAKKMPNDVT